MKKVKRNERICAMLKILTDTPNRVYTLAHFSDMFGSAKSTISEDIDVLQDICERFGLGRLETLTGAAGGVRYLPECQPDSSRKFISELCLRLSDPERILPGEFVYMLDILSHPAMVRRMGEILAMEFAEEKPDYVVTIETKGIPVALMAAHTLNVPLVIARRDARITDGSVVSINYVSPSTRQIQTMSLAKRSIRENSKALIIDDFMRGGGSVKGIMDLMREFSVRVVGVGVVMATSVPENKMVSDYKPLMVLNTVDEGMRRIDVRPAAWLK